jgi:hypothetical protein
MVLLFVLMGSVVLALASGLFVMVKGGSLNKKFSNKLMRARVLLQGIALVAFALLLLVR